MKDNKIKSETMPATRNSVSPSRSRWKRKEVIHLVNWGSTDMTDIEGGGYIQQLFSCDTGKAHSIYRFSAPDTFKILLTTHPGSTILVHATEFLYPISSWSIRYTTSGHSIPSLELLASDATKFIAKIFLLLLLCMRFRVIIDLHEFFDKSDLTCINKSSFVSTTYQDEGRKSIYLATKILSMIGAKKIIFHNKRLYKNLIQKLNQSPTVMQLEYIPHFNYRHQFTSPSASHSIARRKQRKKALQFIFFGLIIPAKGVQFLLPAFKEARELGIRLFDVTISLTVAGRLSCHRSVPQDKREDFINEIMNQSNKDGITIINSHIDNAQAACIVRSADCAVLPFLSGTTSGSANYLLSLGIPCILTDCPAFYDINESDYIIKCAPGDSASLVESLLHMTQILVKPENCKEKINSIVANSLSILSNIQEVRNRYSAIILSP